MGPTLLARVWHAAAVDVLRVTHRVREDFRQCVEACLANEAVVSYLAGRSPGWSEASLRASPVVRVEFDRAFLLGRLGESLAAARGEFLGVRPLDPHDPLDPVRVVCTFKESSPYQKRFEQRDEETSEQLDYRAASPFVVEHVRVKLACRHCQGHVAVADKPPQPIERGLPGPGLLAQVITGRFSDPLPLYRQEGIFARHGVEISRKRMCGWMAQAAWLLGPIWKANEGRGAQVAGDPD